jgi:hypothetical protein
MSAMRISGDQEQIIRDVLAFIRRRWWIYHAPHMGFALLFLVLVIVRPSSGSVGGVVSETVFALLFASLVCVWIVKPLQGLLCPRCGRPFFWRTRFFNAPRRCSSCGLRLDGGNMLDDYKLADPMIPDYRKR